MDTRIVVGIIVVFVVAFFGYQWWRHTSKKADKPSAVPFSSSLSSSSASAPASAATVPQKSVSEYPVVAGQTESELRTKEPLQNKAPVSEQEPVTLEGHAPAEFESNIRHPEQSFHQPSLAQNPKMSQHEVDSARATAHPSTPSQGEQGFFPEMAQNDGPLVGNVFAFDGMEQTGFATF